MAAEGRSLGRALAPSTTSSSWGQNICSYPRKTFLTVWESESHGFKGQLWLFPSASSSMSFSTSPANTKYQHKAALCPWAKHKEGTLLRCTEPTQHPSFLLELEVETEEGQVQGQLGYTVWGQPGLHNAKETESKKWSQKLYFPKEGRGQHWLQSKPRQGVLKDEESSRKHWLCPLRNRTPDVSWTPILNTLHFN